MAADASGGRRGGGRRPLRLGGDGAGPRAPACRAARPEPPREAAGPAPGRAALPPALRVEPPGHRLLGPGGARPVRQRGLPGDGGLRPGGRAGGPAQLGQPDASRVPGGDPARAGGAPDGRPHPALREGVRAQGRRPHPGPRGHHAHRGAGAQRQLHPGHHRAAAGRRAPLRHRPGQPAPVLVPGLHGDAPDGGEGDGAAARGLLHHRHPGGGRAAQPRRRLPSGRGADGLRRPGPALPAGEGPGRASRQPGPAHGPDGAHSRVWRAGEAAVRPRPRAPGAHAGDQPALRPRRPARRARPHPGRHAVDDPAEPRAASGAGGPHLHRGGGPPGGGGHRQRAALPGGPGGRPQAGRVPLGGQPRAAHAAHALEAQAPAAQARGGDEPCRPASGRAHGPEPRGRRGAGAQAGEPRR